MSHAKKSRARTPHTARPTVRVRVPHARLRLHARRPRHSGLRLWPSAADQALTKAKQRDEQVHSEVLQVSEKLKEELGHSQQQLKA